LRADVEGVSSFVDETLGSELLMEVGCGGWKREKVTNKKLIQN